MGDERPTLTPEQLATIRERMECPDCGAARLRFVEMVPRGFDLGTVRDGVLVFDTSTDEVWWESGEGGWLECGGCLAGWELPKPETEGEYLIDFDAVPFDLANP